MKSSMVSTKTLSASRTVCSDTHLSLDSKWPTIATIQLLQHLVNAVHICVHIHASSAKLREKQTHCRPARKLIEQTEGVVII